MSLWPVVPGDVVVVDGMGHLHHPHTPFPRAVAPAGNPWRTRCRRRAPGWPCSPARDRRPQAPRTASGKPSPWPGCCFPGAGPVACRSRSMRLSRVRRSTCRRCSARGSQLFLRSLTMRSRLHLVQVHIGSGVGSRGGRSFPSWPACRAAGPPRTHGHEPGKILVVRTQAVDQPGTPYWAGSAAGWPRFIIRMAPACSGMSVCMEWMKLMSSTHSPTRGKMSLTHLPHSPVPLESERRGEEPVLGIAKGLPVHDGGTLAPGTSGSPACSRRCRPGRARRA